MEIHESAPDELIVGGVFALALGEAVLSRVDESARKGRAEMDVVRATGPLEAFGRRSAHGPVAAAVVQFAGRAGAG